MRIDTSDYSDASTKSDAFKLPRSGAHQAGKGLGDSPNRSAHSVDNSRSFTLAQDPGIKPMHDWSIHVPSLPRDAIKRLRGADLSSLAAIAVLRPGNGRLVAADVDSATAAVTGVDWTGDRLVVGLTPPEIATVRARIAELLRRVDQNELALY